uniref:Uncharacterized protein n=1 Tax=Branchiostoma floridae TaxID=7739 RepID=C3ZUT7_BRAFL|eukprot:XP_002587671.1 hypothetical protein BRAFLDRAFT_92715 [Branchiostoma floridae]
MIYNKCLRLPSWLLENDHISMGQVTNHMSQGCDMLSIFIFLFHYSWATLFQGIKLLKLYAWEYLFVGKVTKARKDEIKQLYRHAGWKILANAFTALALFYTLNGPLSEMPDLLGLFTVAAVATKRMGPFLQSLEVEGLAREPRFGAEGGQKNRNVTADQNVNEVRDGSFTWEPESETASISGINLVVPKGKLTIVVGQVGSGKSSLLSAMLGEMRTLEGQVLWNKKHNTVSYATQRAWLLNASLRDNVTFGLPFEYIRKQDQGTQQGSSSAVVADQHLLQNRLSRHLSVSSLQNRLSRHLSVSSLAASVEDVWVRRADWQEDPAKKDDGKAVQDMQYGNKEKLPDGELGKLVETEERMEGDVKLAYYVIFAAACGLHLAILVLILELCQAGVALAMDFWLADWSASHVGGNIDAWNLTEANANYTQGNLSQPMDVLDTTGYYITGYTGLSVGAIVLTAAAVAAAILTSLRGARNLPGNMELFLRSGLKIVSAIVAVAVITPYFLIGMIPIIVFYYFMQKIYRATARELKRINLMKESPVYSQLSQSFGGLSTIRAYRAEERFTKQMMERLNDSFVPLLYSMGAEGWMGVRLVCAGAVIIFVAGLSSVVAGLHGLVSPAWVGLAISYAIRMQVQMFSVVSAFAKVEANMTSVERVEIYSRVPGEIYEQKTGNTIPPEEWPKSGTVQLESVTARYDQTLDPVLTTVTANIRAGEKVGICGRTGSGKSSLTLTLFRMIDMFEGVISIDGVDISRVPLTLLRSRLSIIPQDPVLFSGTIRFNLDPEEDSDDEELWRALEIAQLKDVVTDLPSKLDEMVTEGGENFSVGQRQLFCLARAFVRKSRILIMDEATASVDMETDAILQDVIKVAFGDRTVITVAHRIATILNFDRILVLDQGNLVENDSPDNLLKKPDGLFTAMVKANK